ncbi:unnamed protein product, partial [Prorocentrum cordatum]
MDLGRAARDLILRATDVDYPLAVHWLYDLVVSFYSHSQGGGAGAKALLEGTSIVSYIARSDYTCCQVLAWLAVYWSPFDVVYRALATPRHPARLACVSMDALDAITTACAMVDKAAGVHPRNALLPA